MAKLLSGYEEGFHEWEVELDDETSACGACGDEFEVGSVYWEDSDGDRYHAECLREEAE